MQGSEAYRKRKWKAIAAAERKRHRDKKGKKRKCGLVFLLRCEAEGDLNDISAFGNPISGIQTLPGLLCGEFASGEHAAKKDRNKLWKKKAEGRPSLFLFWICEPFYRRAEEQTA